MFPPKKMWNIPKVKNVATSCCRYRSSIEPMPAFRIPLPHQKTTPPVSGGVVFCLWATKKIFWISLQTNSNSHIKNEILAVARIKSALQMKSTIVDEIKSTHRRNDFIRPKGGFHHRRWFHPPARVDLVENDRFLSESVVFWRRRWDSNPRAVAGKLISSQPRYDHFDTSPYIY